MKKNAFIAIIAALTMHIATLSAQLPIITRCDRVDNYLYDRGNKWVDNYHYLCQGNCFFHGITWRTYTGRAAIVGRRCYTDTTLYIKGIAAPVYINHGNCYDTSMANRNPEYFYIYNFTDSGIHHVAQVRWDTATPNKLMRFEYFSETTPDHIFFHSYPDSTQRYYIPVYEAFFDKPITVNDSFFVAGSMYNSILHDPNTPWSPLTEHPETKYVRWRSVDISPATGNCQTKLRSDKLDFVMYPDCDSPSQDTTWNRNPFIWEGFGCIFPIFQSNPPVDDTTTHLQDTCLPPSNFRAMDIIDRSALLTWDDPYAYLWELQWIREDEQFDSAQSVTIYNNHYNITGLDTAQTYMARIRSICSSENISPWSDTLSFFVPGNSDLHIPTTLDDYTLLLPNPASDLVTVFSSFTIKKIAAYTMSGIRIAELTANSNSTMLDVSPWRNGTYLIVISTDSGITTKKLIIKR